MENKSEYPKQRDPIRYARIIRTAKITGVSTRQVRRVCEGINENPVILDTMIQLAQAEEIIDNLLIEEIKKLVPHE